MPRELSSGDSDISELIRGRLRYDTAISHKQNAVFAKLRVLHFHDLAARSGGALRRDFHNLEQRAQHAAGCGAGAGDKAIGLVHREHHGAEIIRLQNGFTRFGELKLRRDPSCPVCADGRKIEFIDYEQFCATAA